jgi:RNA polymerase sigma-70 factor (ECF subfamily)
VETTEPGSGPAVEEVFRRDSGRVLATLVRFCGDLELAQDAVQDTFLLALQRWAADGTPANPAGWITTTAKRRAVDRVRRDVRRADKEVLVARLREMPDDPAGLDDDRLRLIFTCCHPALALDARVALTLRTVCGLSTVEIAAAFLIPETTLAQRLVRAKRKIQVAGIAYEVPPPDRLADRLSAVLAAVYLVFNEGYVASAGATLAREDLCREALRLGQLLSGWMPAEPEVLGLYALMLLNHSRRRTRVDGDGSMVLLPDQNRRRWDRAEIDAGLALLRRGAQAGSVGQYWLQAAIVAEHARARTAAATDWEQICRLYASLVALTRSPVVALNQAIAESIAHGPAAGLRLLEPLRARLHDYPYFHSAAADMHRRLGNRSEAASAYRRALQLTPNDSQRTALTARLDAIATPRPGGAASDAG